DVPADRRLPLPPAADVRVVGGDVAGCDVRVLADLGVAEIREVRHLRTGADARVLHLHERARLRSRLENGAGAKVTERSHERTGADVRIDRNRVGADFGAAGNR